MRLTARILPLIALVLVVGSSAAEAVPITRHIERQVPYVLPDGALAKRVVVDKVTVDVAPSDRDDDGYADAEDDCPNVGYTAAGGCPPVVHDPVQMDTTTTYAPATTYSSGGCPSYMAGEASSPDAVNPASGASGCYQVLPSTAAAMGAACDDVNAPSCVAAICAAQGNGAWSASGATPC